MVQWNKNIIIFLILLFPSISISGIIINPYIFGDPATCENQTTYTEVDPNSHITPGDGDNCKTSFTNLNKDEDAYVYDDKGVNHFSGDFTHQIEVELTSAVSNGIAGVWMVSNSIDDLANVTDGLFLNLLGLATPRIQLQSKTGTLIDQWTAASTGVLYYITITRDDDGGTGNGQLQAVIRTGSHTGTIEDTLSINLTAQEDFRYIYSVVSQDDNTAASTITGYVQNVELNE